MCKFRSICDRPPGRPGTRIASPDGHARRPFTAVIATVMNEHEHNRDGTPLPDPVPLYKALLHEAQDAAEDALERLRQLNARFPGDVPAPLVEQLEHTHADPQSERREAVRLPGGPDRVCVRPAPERADRLPARVLDRSLRGLALRVPRPLAEGAVVRVRVPGDRQRWFLAQVRHCRPDEGEWVAGCEFLGARPEC